MTAPGHKYAKPVTGTIRVAQITDCHLSAAPDTPYRGQDPLKNLQTLLDRVVGREPDLLLATGDLSEDGSAASYAVLKNLFTQTGVPMLALPGNHDDPDIMWGYFRDTGMFPGTPPHYQYVIEDFPFRVLMLNSHFDDSELPCFGPRRLQWLDETLSQSDKPALIAIHHPPMKTGIDFIDMAGADWYRNMGQVLERHPQVLKIICGHGHLDLQGRLGALPVQMVGSIAHQLIAGRVIDEAPSFLNETVPPMLHQWLDGDLVSGYYPWPADVDAERIDRSAGMTWKALKDRMRGAMKPE